jgi:hypothetical protein
VRRPPGRFSAGGFELLAGERIERKLLHQLTVSQPRRASTMIGGRHTRRAGLRGPARRGKVQPFLMAIFDGAVLARSGTLTRTSRMPFL